MTTAFFVQKPKTSAKRAHAGGEIPGNAAELECTSVSVLHVTPFLSYPSGYIIEDNSDSELTVSRKNEDTMFSLDNSGCVIISTPTRALSLRPSA